MVSNLLTRSRFLKILTQNNQNLDIEFMIKGFKLELRPRLGYDVEDDFKLSGYTMIIHKNQIYSLPYITALQVISKRKEN